SRFSDRAIDLSLQYKQFGDNHSPVLWNSMYGNLDNWPETAHMMALLGIHPDTWLVRITLPDYVDLKNMRISGHSHTVAKIEDPYDLKPHSLISGLKLPRTKPSQNLGLECLNIMYANSRISLHRAKMSVLGYRKSHRDIVICFQMRDVLFSGGKIYRDASSSLENVLILGLPAGTSIPFRII
ncbi:hypothetical protein FNW50_25655, partial [Escherichia coli]|nr:hypothetical protein [Escherichia coli]